MMRTLLLMVAITLMWAALPAQAEDRSAEEIAALTAEVSRLKAENTHLRQAHDLLMDQASRVTKALTTMTSSLNAMREAYAALQVENSQLKSELTRRPEDDPARLKHELRKTQERWTTDVESLQERLNKTTDRANQYAIRMTTAENELAVARETHAKKITSLQERLSAVQAELRTLKADR